MSVIITQPLSATTNISATISTGGTLAVGTFYYRVVASYGYGTTAKSGTYYAKNYGVPSIEVSATTNATNKTITITWDPVPGATGYFVYRTTVSGDYNESVGHYMRQGALTSYLYASTANASTTYIDNGSITPLRVWFFEIGLPIATITGSTEAAPDTLETLYAALNTAGFSANIYRGLSTGSYYTLYEMKVFIVINNGWFKIGNRQEFSHIGSISIENNPGGFTIGNPNSNSPINGGSYRRLFGYTAWAIRYDAQIKWYDSHITDFKDDFASSSSVAGLYNWWYANITGNFICDGSSFNLASFGLTNNTGYMRNCFISNSANFSVGSGKMPANNITLSNNSYGGIYAYYSTQNCVMKNTKVMSLNAADMFFHKDTNVIFFDAINHQFTSEPPTAIASSNPQNFTVRRKYELGLRLVDKDNNPIVGAITTLTNNTGTTITMEPSTTDGSVYLTSGTATSGTTNTLTDSGKSWVVDSLKDYLVEIYAGTGIGQEFSILSNTATVITLKGVWVTTPNTTSKYRIVPIIHTHNYKGKSTAPYYDTTEFFPHTLEIKKEGYETYKSKFKAVDKMAQVLTLDNKVDIMFDTNGTPYTKLDKEIISKI